jgi:hypothetical protein
MDAAIGVLMILVCAVPVVANVLAVRDKLRERRLNSPQPRGFEVKLNTGGTPVPKRKANDHG